MHPKSGLSAKKKPSKTESPVRHYQKPQDVLRDNTLTDQSKKKALDNWEVDAQALQRAEDEGMGGGEPSNLIDVVNSKKSIGAHTKSPPGAAQPRQYIVRKSRVVLA